MDEQRDIVRGYVDLLIKGVAASAKEGLQDMVAWLNWTSFDVSICQACQDRKVLLSASTDHWRPVLWRVV